MKKPVIISLVIAAVLLGALGAGWLYKRSQSPEALLDKLAGGSGDRKNILMRLGVARGDVVSLMLEWLDEPDTRGQFRADLIEMLFKMNMRSSQQRIAEAMTAAIKDPDLLTRRKAVECISVYGEDDLKVKLADCVSDEDPEIRNNAYIVFTPAGWGRTGMDGLYNILTSEQRQKLVTECKRMMTLEKDPHMMHLARSVVGREIEALCIEAIELSQQADLEGAEKRFREALELDSENNQAQVRYVRFLLGTGQREKALKLAKQFGALMEIPELPEAPVIDGDPTDAAWDAAYKTEKFYLSSSRWAPMDAKSRNAAYVGHKDGKLYCAILGYEDDLTKLHIKHQGRDSSVWNDDSAEIVFDPHITDTDMYQFIINPTGSLFDSQNEDKSVNFKCEYGAKTFNDRGYWSCEFAIDEKELDNAKIRSGEIWALILFRSRIGQAGVCCSTWPTFGYTKKMYLYPLAVFK